MTSLKRKLSGSTDGKAIKVVATATVGTTVHTAVAGTTAGTFDELYVKAFNTSGDYVTLTIEFGGVTAADLLTYRLAPKQNTTILAGEILQNAKVVTAFADTANVVLLTGFANTLADA